MSKNPPESKMRVDKALGADDMMPRFLVEIADSIVEPLCNIYNSTLRDGVVPIDWRRANVSPIHKKGSRVQAENYRPISLTSQLCKVFEFIMMEALVDHLEKLCLLYESQHGFRRGRSCLSNLLAFLEKATKAVDDGLSMDVMYLDLAKAFDKVPHERLSRKLTSHGIEGEVRQWLENWLKGRQQRVCIDGHSSTWTNVVSGVPQGSVIVPILFLIYINDLDLGVENEILKFADDTKLYGIVTNETEAKTLQTDLNRLTMWTDHWQIKFNIDKCKVMHIGSSNIVYGYEMNGHVLQKVDSENDLGVIVSSDLKVSDQCVKAYAKTSRALGLISRNIRYKQTDVMLKLFKCLVRPHVEYCTVAWSPHYKKDKHLIEKVQRRFIKMLPEFKGVHYEEVLQKLKLNTLEERRNRADLVFLYKMYKGLTQPPFESMFQLSGYRQTRGHTLKLRKHCTNRDVRLWFFSERVINNWNLLDQTVLNACSVDVFKKVSTYLEIPRWICSRTDIHKILGRTQ